MRDPRTLLLTVLACVLAWPPAGSHAAAEASPAAYEIGSPQEAWIPMPDGVRLAADLFLPQGRRPG